MLRFLMCLTIVAALTQPAVAGVDVRHDPAADFTSYSTFRIVDDDAAQIPEIRDYLIARIAEQLSAAGLRRVESDADLNVQIHVTTEYGGGLTGMYFNSVQWNISVLTASIREFSTGTLIVAIVDAHDERGIWQGVAKKTFQGNDYRVYRNKVDKITRKMFSDFPPKP